MKKATLTIGLFSLVMVLTSFTSPEIVVTKNSNEISLGIDGQSTGGGRKVDEYAINGGVGIDGQSTGGGRKVDVYAINGGIGIDGQSTGGGRKLD